MIYDIIVVGGGASGLYAAIHAALENQELQIAIIEKNNRVGKKILLTGNGRCNLTNKVISDEFYNSDSIDFVKTVINNYNLETTLKFFNSIGILTYCEDNKIFPRSLQASSVVDMLRYKAVELGIEIISEFDVKHISKKNETFYITSYSDRSIVSKSVILATGGKAAPSTGSTGDGYSLAKNFGHKITKLYPSLVQLECDKKSVVPLKGVKFNGCVSLLVDGQSVIKEFGEILFTDYGISGPPIFQISGVASLYLSKGKSVVCNLDLCPDIDYDALLLHIKSRNKNIIVDEFLTGLFNKQINKMLLKKSGLEKFGVSADTLSQKQIETIALNAKKWEFKIVGTKSWNNAQVTVGGIVTDEINPETMESKLVKGLYFAGEIINVDGKCGGYNLQWAWSSGAIAGLSAGKAFKERYI